MCSFSCSIIRLYKKTLLRSVYSTISFLSGRSSRKLWGKIISHLSMKYQFMTVRSFCSFELIHYIHFILSTITFRHFTTFIQLSASSSLLLYLLHNLSIKHIHLIMNILSNSIWMSKNFIPHISATEDITFYNVADLVRITIQQFFKRNHFPSALTHQRNGS